MYEAYHRREQNKISGTDGYRLIHSYLLDERLFTRGNLNAYHVLESMRRLNIQAIVQRRKRFVKPGEYCQAFDDLVQRKFVPEAPNKIWYTDFTYVRVGETCCYVCIIIDGFSGEVIASKVSSHIDTQLACETLEIAINRMKPKGRVILHSDQGGQYRSKRFTNMCRYLGIIQSMSRAGTPTDNAMMESFMGKMKTERLKHVNITSFAKLESEIRIYCTYYNTSRKHSRHNYKTIKQLKHQRASMWA